jgi:spermidine synthase
VLNIAVGLTAIALSSSASRLPEDPHPAGGPTAAAAAGPAAASAQPPFTRAQLGVVLLVFTLSGAIGMALEVVWFRVLTLFLRPTVYGFSVMLATVLAGIALGSYLVTPFLGRVRWLIPLALLEMTAGAVVVLSFTPLRYLPGVTPKLAPYLAPWMPDYLIYPIAASLLVIFPSALLAGLAFPMGLHLWTSSAAARHTAERAGLLYSLNVFGAIAGSLVGGFVLLPVLGSRISLIVLGLASFVSGLALLAVSRARVITRVALGLAGTVAFAVAARGSPDPFVQFNVQRYPAMQPLYVEEGVEATVFVHEFGPQNARRRILTLNGNHQAGSDGPTIYVHRRIGHFPMILHPRATDALVVGLGGGATAGAVSLHDGVQVDVVELADAVVNGARFFETINYNVLGRPNVHVRVDDGRNYLMLTRKRYDIVTADLIQPIFAGAGNLYSREYFTLMRDVLKPGGLVMQWVPGTDAEFKAIARTFLSVFPETTAWADGSLFVGSVEPLTLRRSDFDWKLQAPGRAQGLRDVGIKSFEDLLGTFVAGPKEIRAFVGEGPLLTDDRPLAEYFLSLPRDKAVDLSGLKGDVRQHVAVEASN